MLNREYRILKYIYKHPKITKLKLLQKFHDFEEYQTSISEYVFEENKNKDDISETRDCLVNQALDAEMSIGEISEYVKKNMPDIENIVDNSLIFFSTKKSFKEYLEKRRHDRWLFLFPYAITTMISFISASPTIYKIIKFVINFFTKGTP